MTTETIVFKSSGRVNGKIEKNQLSLNAYAERLAKYFLTKIKSFFKKPDLKLEYPI